MKKNKLAIQFVISVVAVVFVFCGCGSESKDLGKASGQITVGSKNFSEQLILAELMAQLIENKTDLKVNRRTNLGGTMICHGALTNGDIDMYAEYTGTALTAVLGLDVIADPEAAYKEVKAAYEQEFNCEWLEPFGFNNTYAITVRKDDAEKKGWKTIGDLTDDAASLKAGFTAEFSERPDGYIGLKSAYGFEFGECHDMDPGLMYKAIEGKKVDVICAFATDGRIPAYNLQPLEDNKGFFPPYFAAPVVRKQVLTEHPELGQALQPLGGLLDDASMQRLNYLVDEKKEDPEDVARDFLTSKGLVSAEGN